MTKKYDEDLIPLQSHFEGNKMATVYFEKDGGFVVLLSDEDSGFRDKQFFDNENKAEDYAENWVLGI
jgi:hypothetical protein